MKSREIAQRRGFRQHLTQEARERVTFGQQVVATSCCSFVTIWTAKQTKNLSVKKT
jgi:hypothetical protein